MSSTFITGGSHFSNSISQQDQSFILTQKSPGYRRCSGNSNEESPWLLMRAVSILYKGLTPGEATLLPPN